jgi:hypothetical protein
MTDDKYVQDSDEGHGEAGQEVAPSAITCSGGITLPLIAALQQEDDSDG